MTRNKRNGSYRKVLSRRTMLKGAGTVLIGLPMLDAMRKQSLFAAEPNPPARAINVFFGLGVPKGIQAEGLTSNALAPLAEFSDKLALVRGVHHRELDGSFNNHYDGSGMAFTGVRCPTENRAGGVSIDQVLMAHDNPNGLPAGMIPTLAMGSYFRRNRVTRFVHSWKEDGTPAELPQDTPQDLFTRIFGNAPSTMMPDNSEAQKKRRYARSVLDSVIGQYREITSERAGLGAASVVRIKDHLQRIREFELRVFADDMLPPPSDECAAPNMPGLQNVLKGQAPDPEGEGVDINVGEWVASWRLMVDLYVMALQCDMARFGNVLFQSGGERVRLKGRYEHKGQFIYDFDDRRDRGTGGSGGCAHEFWHRHTPGAANTELRHHSHFMMSQIAYFYEKLNDPSYKDDNGGTLLDNAMITMSTELGDGNPHNLESVFHIVGRANETFKAGEYDVNVQGLDLYNTMLEAMGVSRKLGPSGRAVNRVNAILE